MSYVQDTPPIYTSSTKLLLHLFKDGRQMMSIIVVMLPLLLPIITRLPDRSPLPPLSNRITTIITYPPIEAAATGAASQPAGVFHRIHFPINLPISFYTGEWKGHGTALSLRCTRKIYSNNTLHITITKFSSLLAQQLIAPFFLFQVFCVLLWSMDEFYIYAIFTLFTLILPSPGSKT